MHQSCVQDYIIFAILSRFHWDYSRFAQGLHIFVIQELAIIFIIYRVIISKGFDYCGVRTLKTEQWPTL